jgi:hypothetical protein
MLLLYVREENIVYACSVKPYNVAIVESTRWKVCTAYGPRRQFSSLDDGNGLKLKSMCSLRHRLKEGNI